MKAKKHLPESPQFDDAAHVATTVRLLRYMKCRNEEAILECLTPILEEYQSQLPPMTAEQKSAAVKMILCGYTAGTFKVSMMNTRSFSNRKQIEQDDGRRHQKKNPIAKQHKARVARIRRRHEQALARGEEFNARQVAKELQIPWQTVYRIHTHDVLGIPKTPGRNRAIARAMSRKRKAKTTRNRAT